MFWGFWGTDEPPHLFLARVLFFLVLVSSGLPAARDAPPSSLGPGISPSRPGNAYLPLPSPWSSLTRLSATASPSPLLMILPAPLSRSYFGFFLALGSSGRPGARDPPPGTPLARRRHIDCFFLDQQIANGKLMYECHFSSFVLRFSDLTPHLPLVIWVFFPSGARDRPIRRRDTDWLFFPPICKSRAVN